MHPIAKYLDDLIGDYSLDAEGYSYEVSGVTDGLEGSSRMSVTRTGYPGEKPARRTYWQITIEPEGRGAPLPFGPAPGHQ